MTLQPNKPIYQRKPSLPRETVRVINPPERGENDWLQAQVNRKLCIHLHDGRQLRDALLLKLNTFTLVVKSADTEYLVFKCNIVSINAEGIGQEGRSNR